MVRILHVVTDMGRGGLETMLMNYYRNVDRTKVQFDFLTHREYQADYDEEIEKLGGKLYHLPRLNPFSLKYKKSLHDFFRNHAEYKVIHVHQDCLSSVVLKIAKKRKIPVRIAHSHNCNQNKDLKYPIKWYYKHFIKKYATDLFACSKIAGKWMFGKDADFIVLNNAIDSQLYTYDYEKAQRMRTSLNIEKNDLVLGHIGRFSYQKNHSFLLDVFASVAQKKKTKLLLVGDGDLKADILTKVKDLNLEDRVIFTGIRPDVADLLQAMDCFVFPSHFEGFGIAAIEAQASGMPCLISDTVPSECIITDLVKQIPLSYGADYWASCIESGNTVRKNTQRIIRDSGYDIHQNAKWLEEYYLEKNRQSITHYFHSFL